MIHQSYKVLRIILIFSLLSFIQLNAQVAINTDGSDPDSSAILDLKSTNSGLLIPRMTSVQRDSIESPVKGLLIFNNETNDFWFFDGNSWKTLGNSASIFEYDGANNLVLIDTSAINDIANDDFIFGALELGETGNPIYNQRFFFDKSKGAFRAGIATGDQWDNYKRGVGSFAAGSDVTASGAYSITLGEKSRATGSNAIALGRKAYAYGDYSFAWGNRAQATQEGTIAFGKDAFATGNYSYALGYFTSASGAFSTAIGAYATASNTASIALGSNVTASGQSSIAIGSNGSASGLKAISAGFNSDATGQQSIALGHHNLASGRYAIAMGVDAEATGRNTVVLGSNTVGPSAFETVVGRHNQSYTPSSATTWVPTDRIFSIGNGDGATNKSNALTILKNGNVGIGTSTPTATLDLEGTLHYVDGNQGNGKVLTSDAFGNATWQTAPSGSDNQNLTGASLTGTTLQIDIENGNSVSVNLGSLALGADTIYGQGDSLIVVSNGGVDTAYVDLGSTTNTYNQILTLSNDTLFIQDGNFVVLTDNVNDADADPTNELQDLGLNGTLDSLTISGGQSIALSVLQDGTGTDDQTLSLSNDTLSLEDGGFVVLTDYVNDADADPTNELQALSQNGTDVTLSNGGGTISVDDGDWIINGNNQYSGLSGNVGIGTTSPISGLHVAKTDGIQLNVAQAGGIIGGLYFRDGYTNSNNRHYHLGITSYDHSGGGTGFTDGMVISGFDGIGFVTNTTNDLVPGSMKMLIDQNGNVGIGTLSPLDKLHVDGSIRMVDGNQASGYIPVSDANGTMVWTDPATIATADSDTTNELQTLSQTGTDVTLSNGGGTISVADNDNDATNEIQTLSLTGNTLAISGSNDVDLSGYVSSDNQNLTGANLTGTTLQIDIENGNSVSVNLSALAQVVDTIYGLGDSLIFVSNGETDTSFFDLGSITDTDDQILSLSNDTLFIQDGNFVVLPDNVNDADADASNELQTLTQIGTDVTLSNGGGIISVADNDNDASNEIQTLSLTGNTLAISGSNDVDLSGYVSSDNQNLTGATLTGTTLQIDIEGGSSTSVNLSSLVDDADADASNELQTLSQTGTDVTLSNGGGTISVADNDNDTSNELQSLSISGTDVTLSNGGGTISVADNDNDASNELQTLSISGNDITLSNGGGKVSLPADNDWTIDGTDQYAAVSGNVGIGTSSPTSKLHLQSGDLLIDNPSSNNAASRKITIAGARDGGVNPYASIDFQNRDSNNGNTDYIGASIQSYNSTSNNGGNLRFLTDNATRLTIDHNGRIGVGTISPESKLHVRDASTGESSGIKLMTGFPYEKSSIYHNSDNDLVIRKDLIPNQLVLDDGGNIGIGTDSPNSKLHVHSGDLLIDASSASNAALRKITIAGVRGSSWGPYASIDFQNRDPDDGNTDYIGASISSHNDGSDNGGDLRFITDSSTRLRIKHDGNIGVGTADPSEKLHVIGSIRMVDGNQAAGYIPVSDADGKMVWTDASNVVDVDSTNEIQTLSVGLYNEISLSKGGGTITLPTAWVIADADDDTKVNVAQSLDDDKIRFDTRGSERMIIREDGKVGIGTGSPDVLFHISSDSMGEFDGIKLSQGVANSLIYHNSDNDLVLRKFNQTNQLVLDGSGNVGIGTENPTEQLQVDGSIRMVDGNEANGYVATSDANGTLSWKDPKRAVNFVKQTGTLSESNNTWRAVVPNSATTIDVLNGDIISVWSDANIRFTSGSGNDDIEYKVSYEGCASGDMQVKQIRLDEDSGHDNWQSLSYSDAMVAPCSGTLRFQFMVRRSAGDDPWEARNGVVIFRRN